MGDGGERITSLSSSAILSNTLPVVFWKRLHGCWNLAFRFPIIRLDFGEFNKADNPWSVRLFVCLGFLFREGMVSFLFFCSIISVVTNSRSSFWIPEKYLGLHISGCLLKGLWVPCSNLGF